MDFYPRVFAARIEAAFASWLPESGTSPEGVWPLGSDFFNATVHFKRRSTSGGVSFWQTTPVRA
eukprot:5155015-Prymnesium_polylepis.1